MLAAGEHPGEEDAETYGRLDLAQICSFSPGSRSGGASTPAASERPWSVQRAMGGTALKTLVFAIGRDVTRPVTGTHGDPPDDVDVPLTWSQYDVT